MRLIIAFLSICFAAMAAWSASPHELLRAGTEARNDGNYERALRFYRQALDAAPADSVVLRYEALCDLRNLCLIKLKRYDAAAVYGKWLLALAKSYGGGMRPGLAEEYNFVGNAYAYGGLRDSALCYLDSAARCLLLPGTSVKQTIEAYWSIGISYHHIGMDDESLDCYRMAVDFCRRENSPDNLRLSLNSYANQLYALERYDESRATFAELRDFCREHYGRNSEEYRWASYAMANIMAFAGDIPGGGRLYAEVADEYRSSLTKQLRYLPSEKREACLGDIIEILNNMVPFGVQARFNDDDFTRTAYEQLLLTKGLLLASERTTSQIIEHEGSETDKTNLAELNRLQHTLLTIEAGGAASPGQTLDIYRRIKELDAQIAESCSAYGDIAAFASARYDDVRAALADDEVLLDFTDFKPRSRPRQYFCFEIRKHMARPHLHYVCNGAELDSLLQLEHGLWGNLYSGEAADDLRRIIGTRLKNIIGAANTVSYVPSGVFHKLSLEAIPEGEPSVRMADRRRFRRLSLARRLLETPPADGAPASGRIYGGLTYETDVAPLPASGKEVREIAAARGWRLKPELLTDTAGTKESFFSRNGAAPEVIHLSTHGFYHKPDDPDLPASLRGYNDAMSLSGLVMAGGSPSSRRGLLTAEEVSRCDLSATKLVCLASCHSGQGEVTPEGIYGLQRAFKKAGAQSVVMHLWEAGDEATRCFMTTFYASLLDKGDDRHTAFDRARSEVRRRFPSPFYWAGFVMVD